MIRCLVFLFLSAIGWGWATLAASTCIDREWKKHFYLSKYHWSLKWKRNDVLFELWRSSNCFPQKALIVNFQLQASKLTVRHDLSGIPARKRYRTVILRARYKSKPGGERHTAESTIRWLTRVNRTRIAMLRFCCLDHDQSVS